MGKTPRKEEQYEAGCQAQACYYMSRYWFHGQQGVVKIIDERGRLEHTGGSIGKKEISSHVEDIFVCCVFVQYVLAKMCAASGNVNKQGIIINYDIDSL